MGVENLGKKDDDPDRITEADAEAMQARVAGEFKLMTGALKKRLKSLPQRLGRRHWRYLAKQQKRNPMLQERRKMTRILIIRLIKGERQIRREKGRIMRGLLVKVPASSPRKASKPLSSGRKRQNPILIQRGRLLKREIRLIISI